MGAPGVGAPGVAAFAPVAGRGVGAAADLVAAVKQEMYSTGKSYDEISRHLVTTNGWFGLSVAAFAEDGERSKRDLGVEIASA